ncbi:Os04g0339601 [Oryza sativa Japonica Group]|jgi:hypothetical protein|uniref:Os04g0339601 protein n=1 Tax=Oryza sativa subsp. japonica TaxID=39947 RepID=A0A0N7KIV3_ORYSJ|nr:Os04g0339601 [Oryza sativa Japonica Group]
MFEVAAGGEEEGSHDQQRRGRSLGYGAAAEFELTLGRLEAAASEGEMLEVKAAGDGAELACGGHRLEQQTLGRWWWRWRWVRQRNSELRLEAD